MLPALYQKNLLPLLFNFLLKPAYISYYNGDSMNMRCFFRYWTSIVP